MLHLAWQQEGGFRDGPGVMVPLADPFVGAIKNFLSRLGGSSSSGLKRNEENTI